MSNALALKALDKAKFELLGLDGAAFIQHIIFSLRMRWEKSIPTLGVDGVTIFINAEFFLSLSNRLRVSALAHEAWHVAFNHITRRGNRDPKLWNFAGDYVINLMLKDAGFEIGKDWLLDEKYRGMTTDEVYEVLKKEQEEGKPMPQSNGLGMDVQTPADSSPNPNSCKKQEQQIKEQIDNILQKAMHKAEKEGKKDVGNVPGYLQRYIEQLRNPKIPWNQLVMQYCLSMRKEDYSYKRPNKRYMGTNFIMPTLYSQGLGDVNFYCDASGSVTDKEFDIFISEGHHLKAAMNPDNLNIITFDTRLRDFHTFGRYEPITHMDFTGKGGTMISPVIDHMEETKPELAIIFTDGEFYAPDRHYNGNVLWLIYENPDFTAPFGRVIHF
jgi:predicted metal-dependent peptidase